MARWLERREGWLKNVSRSERPANSEVKRSEEYGVKYIPLRCPKCGSKNVRCYATYLPTRYHTCKSCGHKFKSIEADE
ncbi:MAG: hypothetical protein Q8O36_03455 [Candidatus Omnitrophota bacterium]|nr:hypothetical protein [Candidatus Omnitrophota bacterium]